MLGRDISKSSTLQSGETVEFDIVEERSVIHDYRGIPVKYLCLDDLLSSKLAVARDKDSDDILFLQMKKEAEKDEIPMRKEYDFSKGIKNPYK